MGQLRQIRKAFTEGMFISPHLDVYKRQPYDRPGRERRHQSRPQVGRAERLRGVPLHAA